MYNFCTLFDSHYLSRGLAMYESLRATNDSFHLYMFAFDNASRDYLLELKLPSVTVVSLLEFENPELLSVKSDRTCGEYCWTCTPHVIKYALERFSLTQCTYVDADLYFFSDPARLIDEMKGNSVLITEHRYTPQYDQSEQSGIYCVQFMTFQKSTEGMKALDWWADACLDWCFNRVEPGRFGDQKYLDDWLTRFEGVHVLQNLGGGIAPWNIQQYDLDFHIAGRFSLTEKISNQNFEMVFYHFHGLKLVRGGLVELGYYKLTDKVKHAVYKPYLLHLLRIEESIKSSSKFSRSIDSFTLLSRDWRWPLQILKRRVVGNMNFHNVREFGIS